MAEWSKALVSGTSHFDGVGSYPTPVMLYCYRLTVLFANNPKIINNIPSTGLTILAVWPIGLRPWFHLRTISMTWVGIRGLSHYTVTN